MAGLPCIFSGAERDIAGERIVVIDIHVEVVIARRQCAPGVDPGEIGAVGALTVEERRVKLQRAFSRHGLPNYREITVAHRIFLFTWSRLTVGIIGTMPRVSRASMRRNR